MDELLRNIAAHRRRIKIARTVETAVRWAFAASILACVYLVASKIAGLTVPRSLAVTVLCAAPLGMAAREWARSFSLRDCAIYLDRALGLDERLSTAVEVAGLPTVARSPGYAKAGAMEGVQAADAAGALARAKLPARRLPREAKLLAWSALLLGALLVIPSPRRSGASGDLELETVTKAEAINLESLASADVGFLEVKALLENGKLVEAHAKLQPILDRLQENAAAEGAGKGSDTQKALDAAGASADALAAQLARLGRTVHAPPPTRAARKLKRQPLESPPPPPPAEFTQDAAVARAVAARLARADWPPRYGPVIRKYVGNLGNAP